MSEIVDWLRQRVAELCNVAPEVIRLDESVTRYGMDSPRATRWIADLSQWLGRPLSPVLAFECPTIASMAKQLTAPAPARTSPKAADAGGSANGHEPVAIVGMSCRLPGSSNPQELWEALCAGRHVARQVDDGRWPIDRYHSEDTRTPGRSHTRWASLLDDAQLSAFDPLFFNISPREAEEIDPQQRIFLELCWEAMQDAGLQPFELKDTRTGVFAGVIWDDYGQLNERSPAGLSLHSATGKARGMVANRASYVFGLQGPSVSIDTACSSSLSAVHLACQSLMTGDCDLVLAGGINLILDPVTMVGLAKFGGLSKGSMCRAFDAGADGFVRGEGGGVVVLKRLSRAIADGDRVYAVIGGSAMNNDGASNGLTAPNPLAQEDVLRQAWSRCGVDPLQVDYIEAHGTGTSLGDPIEAKALGAVFGGEAREAGHPLRIGSVKTNIGHLEAAAGIAGLLKTVLSLHHRALPPSLHLERPNPYIPFDELRIQVQTRLEPWPVRATAAPARAGVSAFGWGGTNCHIALESAPVRQRPGQWRLAELPGADAAQTDELLRRAARHWEEPGVQLGSTAAGAVRLAITCDEASAVPELLEAALAGKQAPGLARGEAVARPKIAFVCSPQGGQWRGMARSLLAEQPVFRQKMRELHEAYAAHAPWSLLEALADDRATWAWQRVHTIQPMIAAVQVGLAALWRSWGITPDYYVGHSLGELTAAHLSGALSLDELARLVIHYSRLQATTDSCGTMAILGIGARDVAAKLTLPPGIVLAGENSPDSAVLSGARELLEPVLAELQAQHVFARFIDVNVAAHSPHIDPIMEELHRMLEPLRPRPAHTPMISTLWAREVHGRELGAGYWPANLREPVRFAQAVELLAQRGVTAFVELNPHPILLPAIRQTLARGGHRALAIESTRRGENETRAMMEGLGQLFVTGHDASARPRFAAAPARALAVVDDPAELVEPAMTPVVLSARSEGGLRAMRQELLRRCEQRPELAPRQLAGQLARLDGEFPYRRVAVHAVHEATNLALESEPSRLVTGELDPNRRRKVVFVCPGQGSQWRGMARDLLATEPVFAEAITRIDQVAAAYLARPLMEELLSTDTGPWRIDVIQPLLFAIEVALGELWRSWGIVPDAVVGHSMGEVAAIHLSGALSLEDAVRVICLRSKLLVRAAGAGAMLAAELSPEDARQLIGAHERHVAIAVSNSPTSTVLSGDAAVLETLKATLDGRGVFCRWVKVDVASHSPQMDPLLDELRQLLEGVGSVAAEVPIYSTVRGERIDGRGLDAQYWVDNLRQTVHFGGAIRQLIDDGHDLFLELSPHPILLSSVEQCIDAAGATAPRALGSMRREEPGLAVMLESAAHLYALGHPVAWNKIAPDDGGPTLTLQPWEREKVWLPAGASVHERAADQSGPHPLLGRRIDNALDPAQTLWNQELAVSSVPWLGEHRVRQSIVTSVTVMAEMVLAALAELGKGTGEGAAQGMAQGMIELQKLELAHPLVLTERGHRAVQVALRADAEGSGALGVFSRGADESAWTAHLRGRFERAGGVAASPALAELQARIPEARSVDELYASLARRGLELGPAFKPVQELWSKEHEALALLELPETVNDGASYVSHPVLLDGALQIVLAALGQREGTFLTVGVDRLTVRSSPLPRRVWSHARMTSQEQSGGRATVTVYDEAGRVVAIVEGMQLARVAETAAASEVAETVNEGLAARLLREPAGQARRAYFEALAREQVGLVLKIAAERIDRRRPLQAMGLTSLMTIELRNRLGNLVGQRLSSTLAWNYPTLDAMIGYLSTLLPVSLDTDEAPVAPAASDGRAAKDGRAARGTIAPPLAELNPSALSAIPAVMVPAPIEASNEEQSLDAQFLDELAKIHSLLASV